MVLPGTSLDRDRPLSPLAGGHREGWGPQEKEEKEEVEESDSF